MATWSDPLVTTIGKNDLLSKVIVYDSCTTVSKFSILGYMSSGEMVPEVMITEEKRSKTGFMASDASRQANRKIGFGTVAFSVSYGSRIRTNPVSYVETKVPNVAISFRAINSSISTTSNVLTSSDSRSEQNRNGFLSINVNCFKCCRNETGVSLMTCRTFILVLRYSINLLRNETKCSARRILPGTASLKTSSESTGLTMNASSFVLEISVSRSPSTSFSYSSWSRLLSVFLTSSTFFARALAPLLALFRTSSVRSSERDSMQTLSILCASSKMMILSLESSLETLSAILGSNK
ncbi:hypothetical protein OGAPHI_006080 [Ogataea philodendri]|uniref:Uncharacterized protein n=1 Tax=Ogataea philodendri TaxID=1378263 RepID=A0A9P8NZ47_9ASCO|nr:uncharacterized protein OGAPHI_006080 [Ogataea philodendri]KAH3661901.1 hypothetical protein OGAPHI_006080 [Ogataea philodendri]